MNDWRDIRTVHMSRSLVLMAAGAAIGLGLAGYGLFTARGTSTLHVPPEDVALVNQQAVSRVDYLTNLQTLYGVDLQHATREERQRVLNDMIREELFVQRGKELDVASTDLEVRNAMVNAVELEIAADALSSAPTEEQLRVYYNAHADRYANEGILTAQDYVFAADQRSAAAAAAADLAAAPPAPALLSSLQSRASGKVGDEQFYFAAKIHLGDKLFEIARRMPDRTASDVIDTPDGLHVLYVTANKMPQPLDFAAARSQVLNDYRNEAINHLKSGDEEFLRKRANVLIADDMK